MHALERKMAIQGGEQSGWLSRLSNRVGTENWRITGGELIRGVARGSPIIAVRRSGRPATPPALSRPT